LVHGENVWPEHVEEGWIDWWGDFEAEVDGFTVFWILLVNMYGVVG
jgi:hypothetical protein